MAQRNLSPYLLEVSHTQTKTARGRRGTYLAGRSATGNPLRADMHPPSCPRMHTHVLDPFEELIRMPLDNALGGDIDQGITAGIDGGHMPVPIATGMAIGSSGSVDVMRHLAGIGMRCSLQSVMQCTPATSPSPITNPRS